MLTTRGMGPGPLLPTFGFGPLGFVLDVPLGGTFCADPGVALFRVVGREVVFVLPCDDVDFMMEVPAVAQELFKVEGGQVKFLVNTEAVRFEVPPGPAQDGAGKPK